MNLPTIHQRLLNARRELEIIFAKECVAEYNASKRTNMNTRWDVPVASPSPEVFDFPIVKRTNEDEAQQYETEIYSKNVIGYQGQKPVGYRAL